MELSNVENDIQRLLIREPTLQRAADQMVEKIAAVETTDHDRVAYWSFLFNAGFYEELLRSIVKRLNANQRVHWGYLIETLAICKIEPSKSVIESTLKGIRRQIAADDLWAALSWDELDDRFGKLRNQTADRKAEGARERKESLLEKFNFLASQRMRDQAIRVLKRMIFLYPEDQHFRDLKASFEEEWARDLISQKFLDAHSPSPEPVVKVSAVERELVDMWTKDAIEIGRKNPRMGYDLAVSLHMIDANDAALEVAVSLTVNDPKGTLGQDWLIAELLLKLRRYVDLLEHLQQLEGIYSADPETAFAVSYLRAHAMKALGQSATAVEILRNIVQVRPNYRSANHLVMEWSVGVATG